MYLKQFTYNWRNDKRWQFFSLSAKEKQQQQQNISDDFKYNNNSHHNAQYKNHS